MPIVEKTSASCTLADHVEDWAGTIEQTSIRPGNSGQDDASTLFRLGHAHLHLHQVKEAEQCFTRAVVLCPERAEWLYRLGYVLEDLGRFEEAEDAYVRALALEPHRTRWQHRLDANSADAGRLRQRRVDSEKLQKTAAKAQIDDLVASKAPLWQRIDALQDGLKWYSDNAQWVLQLADAQFSMNRFEEAAQHYRIASDLEPKNPDWHFRVGWCLEIVGKSAGAKDEYSNAVALDTVLESSRYGIGVFFQRRGRWFLAAKHYGLHLQCAPDDGALHYKRGFALQRCYDWQASIESITKAIETDPSIALWHYRLGFAYERQSAWLQAAAAYEYAVSRHETPPSYWYYRLGYVLTQANEFSNACRAFELTMAPDEQVGSSALTVLSSLATDYETQIMTATLAAAQRSQSPERCYLAGIELEKSERFGAAASAYRTSVQRTDKHFPLRYYMLGRALARDGQYAAACDAFLETRLFKRAHGVDTKPYLKDKELKFAMVYTEYLETLSLAPQTILYESGHGSSISCNPLQICRELLNDPRFVDWTHVWVLNDVSGVPAELQGRDNVIFTARNSDLYLRNLATASHLVNNNTFPPYFCRREKQRYLNTWHGTPLKTLGRDIRNGFMDHKNAARNFLHATHMIAPNQFTADCLIDKYDIAGIFPGKMAVTGYPRIDSTVNATHLEKDKLRSLLGISPEEKVVLYAPTWRGSLSAKASHEGDVVGLLRDLSGLGYHALFRGHSLTAASAQTDDLRAYRVPDEVPTNDLLAIVDVLITDYSSILFDFIVTGRPILYFAYDLAEYEAERGLYFDLNELPGQVCTTQDALMQAANATLEGNASVPPKQQYAVAKYANWDDGSATARAIDFFFFNEDQYLVPTAPSTKRNVLIYQGSFIPNGITTSYLNLVTSIDTTENNLFLTIEPSTVQKEERRLRKFEQNPDHVRVLARVGNQLVTAEERWVIDKFNALGNLPTAEMWTTYNRAFQREFLRMFGYAKFDAVVCFEGYARFWAALFANTTSPAARKSIYLHNDMYREWKHRFRYLESMFRLYQAYDRLVSVTKSVGKENASQLAGRFNLPVENFTSCNNLVNASEIVSRSMEALDDDLDAWMDDQSIIFVTLGRLSPEKGHAKLIRAFAAVRERRPDCKLAILGDGPLFNTLETLIADLKLEGSVLLAGLRLNPFPTLAKADCFVFSSDYEGQGLVVLEALILGVPVISTNVVGPRSILEGGFGLLVDNNQRGLRCGMDDFLNNQIDSVEFDYEKYQSHALSTFNSTVLSVTSSIN